MKKSILISLMFITGTASASLPVLGDFEKLKNKSLFNVTFPGTHDSGAFDLSLELAPGAFEMIGTFQKIKKELEKSFIIKAALGGTLDAVNKKIMEVMKRWAVTQTYNIHNQLIRGIRYFDLRIIFDKNNFRFHHSLMGTNFTDALKQIHAFSNAYPNEIIILNLSLSNANASVTQDFIKMLNNYLGQRAIPKSYGLNKRYGDYIKDKKNIFIFFQQAQHLSENFWSSQFIADQWANTPNVNTLFTVERNFVNTFKAGSQLLNLQWVLTPTDEVIIHSILNPLTPAADLRSLSRICNKRLREFMSTIRNRVNIINVDFFEETEAVALARELNSRP